MKAWKYQDDYFFGDKDKVIDDIISYEYPNCIAKLLNRKRLKKSLENDTKLERVPFLDGKQKQPSMDAWEAQILENEQRVIRLKKMLNSFNSLSVDELKESPIEIMDIRKYTADVFMEERKRIPVSRIVGIKRFQNYDNFGEVFLDFLDGRTTQSLEVEKKLDKLVNLYINDSQAFIDLLKNPGNDLPVASYDTVTGKYFITSGGSHRAFLAKIVNLDTILVDVSPIITLEEAEKKYPH